DRDLAHAHRDLAGAIGHRRLAHDERHRAATARLLVDVEHPGAAEIRLAWNELPVDLELLFAVEQPGDVDAEVAQQRPGVGGLVAERDGEGRRRDDVAPRRRGADSVVQVERIQIAERPREILEAAALDGHRNGRVLFADDRLVDGDRHQAPPFNMARCRNVSMSRTRTRSCLPSAILSLSSHASTAKRYRLPLISSSVALARTFMPTGVGARCRSSIIAPTVPAPAGR